MMNSNSKKFRDGMFLASSRTYGETYMEPIIRKILGLSESPTGENDALDDNGEFGEIKCSKILIELLKDPSLIESVILENDNTILKRLIKFVDCFTSNYYANIQNVKRDHFEFLIYVLLFEDCIKIFKSYRGDISSKPNWCPKHGRYDVVGKSGQFGITKNNIKKHLKNNLIQTLTWDEVYEISKGIILNVNKKHNNTKQNKTK